ncbi:sensor histidine kinase [Flavihumibacter sp.]|uniref:sensor histidine kinase n=1 Tax=Flavihumibacter sp. TaxID=1913981 RepID=UPI002FC96FB4|nr:histidine kinase [Flavihumibacter sediminis]
MKFYRPPSVQWYGFLLSMPVICVILSMVLYDERFYKDPRTWFIAPPLIFLLGMGSWYLHYQYDHFIRSRYPELNQTKSRVMYKLLTNLLVMTPSILLILVIFHLFEILGYRYDPQDLKGFLLVGLCINIIFETLWEVIYTIDKYKESLAEQELLEQMSLGQEFENLKSQVNPHFLFNCFNTLSGLISEDKKKAEQFLNELSKVYRYLLRNNENASTLESELAFIESYCQLLKTRHGDGLQINFEIDRKYYPYTLPANSLQLVVENAVKHNIISKEQPLVLEIFTTSAKQLVINNNLQRKLKMETSTKIGLQNIRSKYKLLRHDGFQVIEGQKNFMVVLPLVWEGA